MGVPTILWPEVEILSIAMRNDGRIAAGAPPTNGYHHGIERAVDVDEAAVAAVAG